MGRTALRVTKWQKVRAEDVTVHHMAVACPAWCLQTSSVRVCGVGSDIQSTGITDRNKVKHTFREKEGRLSPKRNHQNRFLTSLTHPHLLWLLSVYLSYVTGIGQQLRDKWKYKNDQFKSNPHLLLIMLIIIMGICLFVSYQNCHVFLKKVKQSNIFCNC